MLITSFIAFAPHSVAPGPLITSDPVDVLEQHVLHIQVHTRVKRGVNAAPVNQHQ